MAKLLEEVFDVLHTVRVRDKDRIVRSSRRIDALRNRLAKKIRHSDSVETIRQWRGAR